MNNIYPEQHFEEARHYWRKIQLETGETVYGVWVGPSLYRIENIPVTTPKVAYWDIVMVEPEQDEDSPLVFKKRVYAGGHVTAIFDTEHGSLFNVVCDYGAPIEEIAPGVEATSIYRKYLKEVLKEAREQNIVYIGSGGALGVVGGAQ